MTAIDNTRVLEIAKEIDRILSSGIEILPDSPIHEKLNKALNMPVDDPNYCPKCGRNDYHQWGDNRKCIYCRIIWKFNR